MRHTFNFDVAATPLGRLLSSSLLAWALLAAGGAPARAQTKVACVGASTTSGDGSTAGHHYPDELQRLLGASDAVKNFGVSGTTMLKNTTMSYWSTPTLGQALASAPQIAIFWFGGNDAKPENWTTHKGEFLGDYETMVRSFQATANHPRTFVILSLVIHDTDGIPKMVVDDEVLPLVRQAAAETGSGIIDVHGMLAAHPEYFPDGIHPNDAGTLAIAQVVYAALTAAAPDGGADAATVTPDALVDGPAHGAADATTATGAAGSTGGSNGGAGSSGAAGAGSRGAAGAGATSGAAGTGTGATSGAAGTRAGVTGGGESANPGGAGGTAARAAASGGGPGCACDVRGARDEGSTSAVAGLIAVGLLGAFARRVRRRR